MSASTPTIFQSSDLNRQGRQLLDTARDGLARVRDKDGTSLVMTREERLVDLESRSDFGTGIAEATATFVLIEGAVGHAPAGHESRLSDFGDWIWARYLPAEDLPEFISDMRDALYTACVEFSLAPLQESLEAWRETAMTFKDPVAGEILLGGSDDDDYVDATRPKTTASDDEDSEEAGEAAAVTA